MLLMRMLMLICGIEGRFSLHPPLGSKKPPGATGAATKTSALGDEAVVFNLRCLGAGVELG
eukprot:2883340-Lingulodinium_polyedra.AAC.1